MNSAPDTQGVAVKPRGLVSALEALSINSATGSCHDGALLDKVECGAYTASAPQSCQRTGIHLCSRVRAFLQRSIRQVAWLIDIVLVV